MKYKCSYGEWMSCRRKKQYNTTTKLRKAADKMNKFYGGRVEIHGYFCNRCGKFHITTRHVTDEELRKSNDLVF